jgi:hypothetical protein
MIKHSLAIATIAVVFIACNSQTPIGAIPLGADASPDVLAGGISTTVVDANAAATDAAPAVMVFNPPPPGPPKQKLAVRNGNGSYSCATDAIDQYAGCPSSSTVDSMPCDLPAGTVCDIPDADRSGFTSCVCNSAGNHNVFSCQGFGGLREDCPRERPVHGSPCTTAQRGLNCTGYVKPLACTCPGDLPNLGKERLIGCTCDNTTKTWRCESAADFNPASFDIATCYKQPAALPAGPPLDPAKKIAALTADEISTFCSWAVETQRNGGEPPLPAPSIVSGNWGSGFASRMCRQPVKMCLPSIPAGICETLLKRKPCSVSVKQLTECLFTGMFDCQVVGDGCGPLNVDPNCSETFVQLASSVRPAGVEQCAVPLN